MENKILEELNNNYKNKSNKDLSEVLVLLHNDFSEIKKVMMEMLNTLNEIETVYDNVYEELQKRLKFNDKYSIVKNE